jgi:hypothetical protein
VSEKQKGARRRVSAVGRSAGSLEIHVSGLIHFVGVSGGWVVLTW